MDFSQVFIFAIVEGVSEFLPISSTGHLILTSQVLNTPQTEFVKSFEIAIQLGAILSIVVLYWQTLIKNRQVWQKVLTAFIPTAIVGLSFYKFIKDFLIGNIWVTLWALFLGGVVLILVEIVHREKDEEISGIEEISFKKAFFIGVAQSVSIVPGVSRAAASIIGGLMVGASRKVAVEFSFLLAVPTMLGATSLDLVKTRFQFSLYEYWLLGVGFISSFLVALLVVKWLIFYVQKYSFTSFGIYRILLAIIFWLFVLRS